MRQSARRCSSRAAGPQDLGRGNQGWFGELFIECNAQKAEKVLFSHSPFLEVSHGEQPHSSAPGDALLAPPSRSSSSRQKLGFLTCPGHEGHGETGWGGAEGFPQYSRESWSRGIREPQDGWVGRDTKAHLIAILNMQIEQGSATGKDGEVHIFLNHL